jgi:hypothetical protein
MAEDDDGWRWELTVKGLKRWRRLPFPCGVAVEPVAEEDRRQGGWGGGLGLVRGGEGIGEGEKKGDDDGRCPF